MCFHCPRHSTFVSHYYFKFIFLKFFEGPSYRFFWFVLYNLESHPLWLPASVPCSYSHVGFSVLLFCSCLVRESVPEGVPVDCLLEFLGARLLVLFRSVCHCDHLLLQGAKLSGSAAGSNLLVMVTSCFLLP